MSDSRKPLPEDSTGDNDDSRAEPLVPAPETPRPAGPQEVPKVHSVEEAAELLRQLDAPERAHEAQELGDPTPTSLEPQSDPGCSNDGREPEASTPRPQAREELPDSTDVFPSALTRPPQRPRFAIHRAGLAHDVVDGDDGAAPRIEAGSGVAVGVSGAASEEPRDLSSEKPARRTRCRPRLAVRRGRDSRASDARCRKSPGRPLGCSSISRPVVSALWCTDGSRCCVSRVAALRPTCFLRLGSPRGGRVDLLFSPWSLPSAYGFSRGSQVTADR